MGSFQQICLGAICLVAAYLFGNYVNNNPPLHSNAGNPIEAVSDAHAFNGLTSNATARSGNIESRIPISEFAPIENKPAPIVTMKTPLKSRFAVPSIQTNPSNVEHTQRQGFGTNNQLPPPSQLAESNLQRNPVVKSQPFSSSPFTEPVAVSPTIQVPDFSAIAAEFKNTPIELPNMSRLGGMPSHSNTYPTEADRFGTWQNTNRPKERLKQLVQRLPDNEFRNPNFQPGQQYAGAPQPQQFQANPRGDFESRIETAVPNNGFSQADFEPQLNDDIFGLKPQPHKRYEQPNNNVAQDQTAPRAPIGDYQYDVPPPAPPESYEYDNRAPAAAGFRGNLTFRPELENRSGDSRNNRPDNRGPAPVAPIDYRAETQPAPQPARLPFRLTEQAKTELVQLRQRADSKIGLESTSFVDHTIRDGETLQSISARYFGSPNYYLDIYLANRNKLRNPADTQAGISIRVPVYESP